MRITLTLEEVKKLVLELENMLDDASNFPMGVKISIEEKNNEISECNWMLNKGVKV